MLCYVISCLLLLPSVAHFASWRRTLTRVACAVPWPCPSSSGNLCRICRLPVWTRVALLPLKCDCVVVGVLLLVNSPTRCLENLAPVRKAKFPNLGATAKTAVATVALNRIDPDVVETGLRSPDFPPNCWRLFCLPRVRVSGSCLFPLRLPQMLCAVCCLSCLV